MKIKQTKKIRMFALLNWLSVLISLANITSISCFEFLILFSNYLISVSIYKWLIFISSKCGREDFTFSMSVCVSQGTGVSLGTNLTQIPAGLTCLTHKRTLRKYVCLLYMWIFPPAILNGSRRERMGELFSDSEASARMQKRIIYSDKYRAAESGLTPPFYSESTT